MVVRRIEESNSGANRKVLDFPISFFNAAQTNLREGRDAASGRSDERAGGGC